MIHSEASINAVFRKYPFYLFSAILCLFICNCFGENNVLFKKQTQNPKSSSNRTGQWSGYRYKDSTFIYLRYKESGNEWLSFISYKTSQLKNARNSFTISNNAGKIKYNGGFIDQIGKGSFRFLVNQGILNQIEESNITGINGHSNLALVLGDVSSLYIKNLSQSYGEVLSESDLVKFHQLNIDRSYISLLKQNGYGYLSPMQIISARVLNVNDTLLAQMPERNRTYPFLISKSTDKIHPGKNTAQAKNQPYLDFKKNQNIDLDLPLAALDVNYNYYHQLKALNLASLSLRELSGFISNDITATFIQQFSQIGYTDIPPLKIIALKALGVDKEYITSFKQFGYPDFSPEDSFVLKSIDISANFPRSFAAVGYKEPIPVNALFLFKWDSVTPEYVKGVCGAFGYLNIHWASILECKLHLITPGYIDSIKKTGQIYGDIHDYISLKKNRNSK